MLSKAQYDRIRSQLEFRPSPAAAALTLAFHAALLLLAVELLTRHGRIGYWVAQLLLPVVFFQAFSMLHECGHGSFSSSRAVNTLVGHYASVLCFLPFFPWKYIHTQHHVWAGNADKDPGLALVKRARDTGKLPRLLLGAWRTWLPLGGFAQHLVYWSYPVVAFRRGTLRGVRLLRCAVSVLFLAFAYMGASRLSPSVVSVRSLAPAIFLYLVLVELVNIPHHVGLTSFQERLPLWKQHLPTRSCDYPPVLSELLVLNFNFHIEHHLFPTLPWYRLRQARRLVKPALGQEYRETRGLAWHVAQRKRGLVDVLSSTE
ncbi:MAG TPA: fatty acid desaturase [Polyangiales bacterium]